MPSGGGVQSVEALFLLLLVFVASFAALARKLKIPYPIVLVIAGLLLGFLPGVPRINLDPDIVFLVFLPPLLHAAAWTLSWREFQRNFLSIAKLAVGLVFFTTIGLALSAGKLLPGFDWNPQFSLVRWSRQQKLSLRPRSHAVFVFRSGLSRFLKLRAS